MSSKSTKQALGIQDQTETIIDAESEFVAAATDPANQEMEKFVAPDGSTFRRKLVDHELMAWVAMQANMNSGDDADAGMRMFAQIAEMDSLSDVLAGRVETVKSREILNTIMACHGIKFMAGNTEDGCPYFAICDVVYGPDNKKDTISIGGWYAIAQLARLHYQSADFEPGSQYLVSADTPNAQPKESFPHYFQVKQKATPKGHMNYLAPAIG